jgi:hypothetical protein
VDCWIDDPGRYVSQEQEEMKSKSKPAFRVFFNHGKQHFDVYIANSSRKFMNENKCWAYYQPASPRKSRQGKFGEVHFSRIGSGLVSHELMHLFIDWLTARGNFKFTSKNEERVVSIFAEMFRMFYVKYWAWKEHTSI